MTFNNLGISGPILKALDELGFEEPSEIQAKAIPLAIEGHDIIAKSATGSGKTLAFGAGLLDKVQRGDGIQALILAPTRELAEQVSQELKKFSRHHRLVITPVYGGVSINPQIKALQKTDIVVGTPGRVMDLMQREDLNLSRINTLILDEADRMLDMGFIEDVEKIVSQCPTEGRQTLLFSATMSSEIRSLAKRFMNNPKEVSVESYVDPKKLSQIYYNIGDKEKFSLLVHLLKEEHDGLVMVFCNTQKNTDFVARNLQKNGLDAVAIHGGLSQAKRNKTLERFNNLKVFALVCTDVAARGLDIKGISHVYNYDIPRESKQYIHRIGRTARAGKEGKAINILSSRDHENFSYILRDYDVTIPVEKTPAIKRVPILWKPDQGGHRRSGFGPRNGPRGNNRSGGQRRSNSGPRRRR